MPAFEKTATAFLESLKGCAVRAQGQPVRQASKRPMPTVPRAYACAMRRTCVRGPPFRDSENSVCSCEEASHTWAPRPSNLTIPYDLKPVVFGAPASRGNLNALWLPRTSAPCIPREIQDVDRVESPVSPAPKLSATLLLRYMAHTEGLRNEEHSGGPLHRSASSYRCPG